MTRVIRRQQPFRFTAEPVGGSLRTSRVPNEGEGMKKAVILLLAVAAVAVVAVLRIGPDSGQASSHREAPLIADDPVADSTDLYAFRSPDRPDTVTIIANYIPAEDPAAGPNWYTFSPHVRYSIHIDRGGDGRSEERRVGNERRS